MTEALSFAIQAEIPTTVVFSQRAGPSTGTPTFHENGDINWTDVGAWGNYDSDRVYWIKRMADKLWEKYPGKFSAFRTILNVVDIKEANK